MLYLTNRRSGERPARSFSGRLAVLWAVSALLLATGCASRRQVFVIQEDVQRVQADVDTLKRVQQAAGETLRTIESEVRDLKAKSEYGSSALEEKVEGLAARLDELVTRMDRALAPLEEFIRRQSATDTTQSPALGMDYYDAAVRDLSLGNYDLAEVGFLQFLENYPKSDLADDARYGLGESYYARKRYEEAIEEYQRVVALGSGGGKAPAAMLKSGLCYLALQRTADARQVWEELKQKFPYSEEAKVAEQRLGELTGRN
jgi:tol-pal system protein YbgF